MSQYNKAIGATIGAAVAWGVALGFPAISGIDIEGATTLISVLGGIFGTYIAPPNR